MNNPVHASVDAAGCVVVADSGNDRVCLFSPSRLLLLRELVSSEANGYELWQPYRALIEPASGRLYVGTNDGFIFVFRAMHKCPAAVHT